MSHDKYPIDLDPTKPNVFERILDAAGVLRAQRQGKWQEEQRLRRIAVEKTLAAHRMREEEGERRRAAIARQQALDGPG